MAASAIQIQTNVLRFRCYNIDYDVSDDDLNFMDDCHEAIVMPEEVEVEIDAEDFEFFGRENEENLVEYLENAISEETGWLVNGFDYELIFD